RPALALSILIVVAPIPLCIAPFRAIRYALPSIAIGIAAATVALARLVPEVRLALAGRVAAALFAVILAGEAVLLADRYARDLPEAEIRAAIDASGSRGLPIL